MTAGKGPELSNFTVDQAGVDVMAALTSVDGKPLADSSRMVIVLSTRAVAQGLKVRKDDESILVKPATRPILYNTGKFDLSVKTAQPEAFKLYALDINGNRRCELPLRVEAGVLKIALDTDTLEGGPAVFFELVREQK